MQPYVDLLRQVLDTAKIKQVEGKNIHSVFGIQMSFDVSGYKFPLVTIRNTDPQKAIHELLWAIRGETTIDALAQQGISRWDEHVTPGTAIYKELTLIERLLTTEGKPFQESHNPERFFSKVKLPDHEYVEIYEQWRPIGIVDRLHKELDYLGVPRRLLFGGDLESTPGLHWRKRPVGCETTEEPITRHQAYRYLQASGHLGEFTERFEAKFGAGSLDLWLLTSEDNQRLAPELEEDRCIEEELYSLGYNITEQIPDLVEDQLLGAITQLKSNPNARQASVISWLGDEIDSLFVFHSRQLTHQEQVGVLMRSNLIRKADFELFNSMDPIDREKYLELDEVFLQKWSEDNHLPTRGLLCHLYQGTVDLYIDLPMTLAIYSLLTKMVAHQTGMEPLQLIWTGADCFLAGKYIDQVAKEICKDPLSEPSVLINTDVPDIDGYSLRDFTVVDYQHN